MLLGNGNRTFAAPVDYPAAASLPDILVGDVNGDGKADLVTVAPPATGNDRRLMVLLGNGDGTFAAVQTSVVNIGTYSAVDHIALDDLNNDGALDLILAGGLTQSATVLLGSGNGTFGPPFQYTANPVDQGNSFGLSVVDVNGDGNQDVVMNVRRTSSATDELQQYNGNGDGTLLAPPGVFGTPSADNRGLVKADFDGNGRVAFALVDATTTNTLVRFLHGSSLQVLHMSRTPTNPVILLRGQNGSFTVTVSNVGLSATIGTVTVTQTLSSNLTFQSMSGTGWSCTANSCTRSDALNAGASYPAITVNMGVSVNALSQETGATRVTGTFVGAELDETFDVTSSSCMYSLGSPTGAAGGAGGTGSVNVTATAGCTWSALSNVPWLAIASGSPATGNGTVNYSVLAGTTSRTGTLTIAGQTFTVTQTPGVAVTMSVSETVLNFGVGGGTITGPQSITISFSGGARLGWTVQSNQSNVVVSPAGATGVGLIQVTATAGPSATITVTAPGASNSPITIQVNVATVTPGSPFGSFDTPVNNTTGIAGAVGVTGWALDNIEVVKVQIWRDPVGTEPRAGNGLVFIGDATFVPGARPDVQGLYPTYPLNYRAGWGYSMLTTGLPKPTAALSGASGTGLIAYTLIAINRTGSVVELGTKTITCDNAHATKPFGTLDTPGQGGDIVSGTLLNFGWALTQQPYMIPIDGSTIWVGVDGVLLGHPVYNQFRSDIANGFPGYANSNGAVGYFYLDTTTLSNGLHNIGWLVSDNAGRTDGVGSRFITVLNNSPSAANPEEPTSAVPAGEPVKFAEDAGPLSMETEELGRIELKVGASAGYSIVNGERHPLPIGSTLKDGVFYWQVGLAFLGDFNLVFERPMLDGTIQRVPTRVSIHPKRYVSSKEELIR